MRTKRKILILTFIACKVDIYISIYDGRLLIKQIAKHWQHCLIIHQDGVIEILNGFGGSSDDGCVLARSSSPSVDVQGCLFLHYTVVGCWKQMYMLGN